MSGEWQVALRKGRSKAAKPALQLLPFVTESADQSQQSWTFKASAGHVPAASTATCKAAVARLYHQITNRSKEIVNSAFLQGFQQLLRYAERQELIDKGQGQDSHQGGFPWGIVTELVIYGLGSPAAGQCH